MNLLRDVFWIACLLMIMGVISASGLRHSTHWNAVEIGPIPPARGNAQVQAVTPAGPATSAESTPATSAESTPAEATPADTQKPVTLAQLER